uniref:CSON001812 protein n=1 Tax=Culicoides sonorensis TaxID=179676 RepID=A0A336LRC3_CULSO
MSDSDDSLPYLDLENLPYNEDEPIDDISSDELKRPEPSTSSKGQIQSLDEIIGGGDDILKKLASGDIGLGLSQNLEDIDDDDLEIVEEIEKASSSKSKLKAEGSSTNLNVGDSNRWGKRIKKFLPPALQGLMGQANLCFARGETELAEKFCLQIIKEEPFAPEPFLTLASIYEGRDTDKYTQFSLIAAHLNPGDVDQWIRVAEFLIEQGKTKQAITCYSKAIKADPRNFEIRLKRIELLEMIGEDKHAFRSYHGLIPHIPPEKSEFLIAIAKKVAKKFHDEKNVTSALSAIENAYAKVPNLFKLEDLNLFLELLLETGNYKKALDILCKHTEVKVVFRKPSVKNDEMCVESLSIPDDLILDFQTKLIVALIHLKCFSLLDQLIQHIFDKIDIEDAGDCYLDVAEALIKEEKYEYALKLLTPLVKSTNYSLAAVWLRHADCHREMGNIAEAISSYRCVINLAQHLGARLTLAALLKQKGEFDEALDALYQSPDTGTIDPGVLYERCLLFKEIGRHEDLINNGFLLISRHCCKLRNRQEMQTVCILKFSNRIQALKDIRQNRCEPKEDFDLPEFGKSDLEPTLEQEWNLLLDILKSCYTLKMYRMLRKITFTALYSKRLVPYQKEIEFLAFLSCLYCRDYNFGYALGKEWLLKDMKNKRLWNIFNQIIQSAEDIRYIRFISRSFAKYDVPQLAHIMQGNNYLTSGSYKYAMNDFVVLYKDIKDPILPLLISVTLTNIACQKYSAKKHSVITQVIAYMEEYRKLREPEASQEIYYNFGRMYHQLGMISHALDNYKKALNADTEWTRKFPQYLSLKAEIAFNIHLIYKASGNYDMARKFFLIFITEIKICLTKLAVLSSNKPSILLQNGWDRPLLVETLEQKYKINTNRDLSCDCSLYRFSVEDFIVRSEIIRLFLKNGKIHAYLAPEKLEQPLPPPTVPPEPPRQFKRKRKNRGRRENRNVKKFKANPWGSFEPIENNPGFNQTINELKPRPAFGTYSDEEEYDDVPQEIETQENSQSHQNDDSHNRQNNHRSLPRFHTHSSVMSFPRPTTSSSYNSTQQIDGPTMLDFQEVNNPAFLGYQDLSYYIQRQHEANQFNYNELPAFRRCINFRARQQFLNF